MGLDVSLDGRRVLVTGAGQGVGRGIAAAFAAAGAQVCVNDLVRERADAVVEELRSAGGTARSAVFDVTDHAAVTREVDALGGVDVLVNNAGNAGAQGFGRLVPFAESAPEDWDRYLRVNLHGVLHCTRAVLPHMVARRWGRVVTVVSDAGRTGDAGLAVYGAAKAGAAALTRAVAVENGRHGITANSVALGTMRTPLTEPLWAEPDATAAALLRRYVVRRPGLPEDVAALVVLLASEHGSWITGQTVPVNGGCSFAL